MSSVPQAKSRLSKAPNLDMHDKLVKRGRLVCWYGFRAPVLRVRQGRCLIKLYDSDEMGLPVTRWLPCSSVYVVPA